MYDNSKWSEGYGVHGNVGILIYYASDVSLVREETMQ